MTIPIPAKKAPYMIETGAGKADFRRFRGLGEQQAPCDGSRNSP